MRRTCLQIQIVQLQLGVGSLPLPSDARKMQDEPQELFATQTRFVERTDYRIVDVYLFFLPFCTMRSGVADVLAFTSYLLSLCLLSHATKHNPNHRSKLCLTIKRIAKTLKIHCEKHENAQLPVTNCLSLVVTIVITLF